MGIYSSAAVIARLVIVLLLLNRVEVAYGSIFSSPEITHGLESPAQNIEYVDLFSAGAAFEIPLYNLQSRNGLSFPLNLSYSSSLAKAKFRNCEQNSVVGLGWEVNLPFIRAEVFDSLTALKRDTINHTYYAASELPPYNTLYLFNGVNTSKMIMTGSGDFKFTRYNYEKIVDHRTNENIDSIDIIYADGTLYRFANARIFLACDSASVHSDTCGFTGDVIHEYHLFHRWPNAKFQWDLTRIIDPWGNAIRFEYENEERSVNMLELDCLSAPAGDYTKQVILTRIVDEAFGTKLEFEYSTRTPECDPYVGTPDTMWVQRFVNDRKLVSVKALSPDSLLYYCRMFTHSEETWDQWSPSHFSLCHGYCDHKTHEFLDSLRIYNPKDTTEHLPQHVFKYWRSWIACESYPLGLMSMAKFPSGLVANFDYVWGNNNPISELILSDRDDLIFDNVEGYCHYYDKGITSYNREKRYRFTYEDSLHVLVNLPTKMTDNDSSFWGYGAIHYTFSYSGRLLKVEERNSHDNHKRFTITDFYTHYPDSGNLQIAFVAPNRTSVLYGTSPEEIEATQSMVNVEYYPEIGQVKRVYRQDGQSMFYDYACRTISNMGPSGTNQLTSISGILEAWAAGPWLSQTVYDQPFSGKGYLPSYSTSNGTSDTRVDYVFNSFGLLTRETDATTGVYTDYFYGSNSIPLVNNSNPRYLTGAITVRDGGRDTVFSSYDMTRGLVTMVRGINGTKSFQEYDDYGRPILIKNHDGIALKRIQYGFSRNTSGTDDYNPAIPNLDRTTDYLPDGDSLLSITYTDHLGRQIQSLRVASQSDSFKTYVTNIYYNDLNLPELISQPFGLRTVDTSLVSFGLIAAHFSEFDDGWKSRTGALRRNYSTVFMPQGDTIYSPPFAASQGDTIQIELNAYWLYGNSPPAEDPISKSATPPMQQSACSGNDSLIIKVKLLPDNIIVQSYVCPFNRRLSFQIVASSSVTKTLEIIYPNQRFTPNFGIVDEVFAWKKGTNKGPINFAQSYYEHKMSARPTVGFSAGDNKPYAVEYPSVHKDLYAIQPTNKEGKRTRTVYNRAGEINYATSLDFDSLGNDNGISWDDSVKTTIIRDNIFVLPRSMQNPKNHLDTLLNPSSNDQSTPDRYIVNGNFKNLYDATTGQLATRTNSNNGELFYSYWPNGSLGRVWEIQTCARLDLNNGLISDHSYQVKRPIIFKYDDIGRLEQLATEQDTSKYQELVNGDTLWGISTLPELTTSWGNRVIVDHTYDTSFVASDSNFCKGIVTRTRAINHFTPPNGAYAGQSGTWNQNPYTARYVYDKFGHLTKKIVDPYSTTTSIRVDSDTLTVRYKYDLAGRTAEIDYPYSNASTTHVKVSYEYDDWANVKTIKVNGSRFAEISRDSLNRVNKMRYYYAGNTLKVTDSIEYNNKGQIERRTAKTPPSNALPNEQFVYDYNASGTIRGLTRNGILDQTNYSLKYDSLGQLIQDSSAAFNHKFTIDRLGNILTKTTSPSSTTRFHYGYEDGQPCSTGPDWLVGYGNGADTATYTYNRFGQVVKIDKGGANWVVMEYNYQDLMARLITPNPTDSMCKDTVFYSYDDKGRMVKRLVSLPDFGLGMEELMMGGESQEGFSGESEGSSAIGGPGSCTNRRLQTSYHIYDGDHVIWEQYIDEQGTQTETTTLQYVYVGNLLLGMVVNEQYFLFAINDHLGSSVNFISSYTGTTVFRQKFYSYGEVQSVSGSAPSSYNYSYVGKFREPIAPFTLYNFGFRWYDPNSARFLSPDPIYSDHSVFGYGHLSPYNIVDRLGLAGGPPGGYSFIIDGVQYTQDEALGLFGRSWINNHIQEYISEYTIIQIYIKSLDQGQYVIAPVNVPSFYYPGVGWVYIEPYTRVIAGDVESSSMLTAVSWITRVLGEEATRVVVNNYTAGTVLKTWKIQMQRLLTGRANHRTFASKATWGTIKSVVAPLGYALDGTEALYHIGRIKSSNLSQNQKMRAQAVVIATPVFCNGVELGASAFVTPAGPEATIAMMIATGVLSEYMMGEIYPNVLDTTSWIHTLWK